MRRRLQFSLRGLLGFAALVSVLLGGWHLLETYGNRLEVEDVRIGAPIRVRARYFCLLGPRECPLEVGYEIIDGFRLSDGTLGMCWVDRIKRSWWCLYTMECELDPIEHPCQVVVSFKRHEKPAEQGSGRVWPLQEKIVDVK